MAPGQRADIVLLEDIVTCKVHSVICRGAPVTPDRFRARPDVPFVGLDSVKLKPVSAATFHMPAAGHGSSPVIGIRPGQILTDRLALELAIRDGTFVSDVERDVLKVAVLGRHNDRGDVGHGFVKGFGIARGAIASSIGHDSHNVCVIGCNDADMAVAVNRLIALRGGFAAAVDGKVTAELALPIAGLMSERPFEEVEQGLRRLRAAVAAMGTQLHEPFLQMAFLALPVIPHLRITDKGLVDVDRFELRVILSAAKDLMPVAIGDEVLRCAQDDGISTPIYRIIALSLDESRSAASTSTRVTITQAAVSS